MKLSINKLLIGFLFVFSFILIPTDVAKADSYSVSCGDSQWVNFDLNVSPVADLMAAEAFGGVTSGSGAYYDGYHCPYGISIYAHSDEDSRNKGIFSGYIPDSPSGSMVFLFNTGGMHTIVFSGYVDSNMIRQFGPVSMTTRIVKPFVPPAPTVTIYANTVNPLTVTSTDDVYITWSSTNASSCSCVYGNNISCGSGIGEKEASGNPYRLSDTKTFTVTCN